MSLISTALASALSAIATAKGESLSYCTTYGGTYVALTGFVLHQQRPEAHSQDDDHGMEVQVLRATLKGPLTPAMADGYFIKNVTTGVIYSCRTPKFESQQIANLEVADPKKYGPDRKGAR